MEWREIGQSGEFAAYHAASAFAAETTASRWFRAASSIWTPTLESFESFANDQGEIFGLFDNGELRLCVYVENGKDPEHLTIHLSVLAKISQDDFVKQCSILRDRLFHRGVKTVRGWMCTKNRPLLTLMQRLGFFSTGLKMDQGVSHGRVLRWELMEVARI